MPRPRVFINSTFYDFVQLREDIARFITDMGFEPVRHEAGEVAYGSREALDHYAYGTVESCDMLIAIVGGRLSRAAHVSGTGRHGLQPHYRSHHSAVPRRASDQGVARSL
jgi:hypothetical protein